MTPRPGSELTTWTPSACSGSSSSSPRCSRPCSASTSSRQRRPALHGIAKNREATVITSIHRQESMSLLGFPLMRYIDIDDAESVLRAINETPSGKAIEIILHTPGGLVIAAQQIAIRARRPQRTRRRRGTALRDERRHADRAGRRRDRARRHAALGPVDPQLGQYPAASLSRSRRAPGRPRRRDADHGRRGPQGDRQVEGSPREPARAPHAPERAREVARASLDRRLDARPSVAGAGAQALGLPVEVGMPDVERELMTLYPQPRGRTLGGRVRAGGAGTGDAFAPGRSLVRRADRDGW